MLACVVFMAAGPCGNRGNGNCDSGGADCGGCGD
jgi:hypothetical protein